MFDLSFGEILLVALMAIVFIGPKDMPVVLRAVTRWMKQLKGLAGEFRSAFDELAEESGVRDTTDEISREMRQITGDDGQLYDAYDISDFLSEEENVQTRQERRG